MSHGQSTAERLAPVNRFRHVRWLVCGAFLALAIATPLYLFAAQIPPEIIGRVEGLDFAVELPPGAPPLTGEAANQLTSGSRIVVRSGQARITLLDGGEILICGAARLQLLKSRDMLTIALDYGTVRMHEEGASPLAVYTPQVIATTLAVGGARDATIGLDQDGRMCIRAALGAVRVQQQFGDQTLLVPQFGALSLSGSQITPVSAFASGCTCNLDAAKLFPPRLDVTVGAIAQPGSNTTSQTSSAMSMRNSPIPIPNAPPTRTGIGANAPVPPIVDEPIYKVLMPALRFDASSPEPPSDPSAETILLVRTAVVHGEVVYRGSVAPGKNRITKTLEAQANAGASPQSSQPGVFARIGGFFRRLFGGKA
jgi:hypothetical protein